MTDHTDPPTNYPRDPKYKRTGQRLTGLLGITERLQEVSVRTHEFVNVTICSPDGSVKVVPAPVDPTYVCLPVSRVSALCCGPGPDEGVIPPLFLTTTGNRRPTGSPAARSSSSSSTRFARRGTPRRSVGRLSISATPACISGVIPVQHTHHHLNDAQIKFHWGIAVDAFLPPNEDPQVRTQHKCLSSSPNAAHHADPIRSCTYTCTGAHRAGRPARAGPGDGGQQRGGGDGRAGD